MFAACGLSVSGTLAPVPDGDDASNTVADVAEAGLDETVSRSPNDAADAAPSAEASDADAVACSAVGATCSGAGVGTCCAMLYCKRGQFGPDRCEACIQSGSGCYPNGPNAKCRALHGHLQQLPLRLRRSLASRGEPHVDIDVERTKPPPQMAGGDCIANGTSGRFTNTARRLTSSASTRGAH